MCLTVNGKDIMESENLKLLDVTIDCDLNFNVHISNICKKASQRIGVIMRLRNLIPTEAQPVTHLQSSHSPLSYVLQV